MHYNFVTRAQFEALRADRGFVETAEFGHNLYGTSKAAVAAVAEKGRTCVLDVEMEVRFRGITPFLFFPSLHSPHLRAAVLSGG